jgi:UDP-glucose 4-epimerase
MVGEFVEHGYDVAGLGYAGSGDPPIGLVSWHEGEVTLGNLESLDTVPEIVVHCAGGSSVAQSIAFPESDRRRTVESTQALVTYIRNHGGSTKLTLVSSAAVYGDAALQPIDEDAPKKPISPYGVHKLIAEEMLLQNAKAVGLRCAIVRLFSVYGESLRKQLLWDACRKYVLADNRFAGTGSEQRDWVHVSDAVALLRCAAEHADASCPIVNGGTGIGTTTAEILQELWSALGGDGVPEFTGIGRAGDPQCYQADITRARALGWQPEIHWKDGIHRYAEWFGSSGR